MGGGINSSSYEHCGGRGPLPAKYKTFYGPLRQQVSPPIIGEGRSDYECVNPSLTVTYSKHSFSNIHWGLHYVTKSYSYISQSNCIYLKIVSNMKINSIANLAV